MTGGWHWWATLVGGHWWVALLGNTGGWAQVGGSLAQVGALLGTGGRNLRVALLGTDHQGTDHQCPDDRCRSPL
ncbi:unnamed protein product [Staurois parvus]|uniref:Secreted protein n=1 Tax=Staurois parvus TaxID=386267 RepID=A0ABN9C1J0_9NEOB|nr:unnamed protein product [Staurois parvus]